MTIAEHRPLVPAEAVEPAVRVSHAPWLSRVEARNGDRHLGFLRYDVRGTWAVLSHTEIREDAGNAAAVGAALVTTTVDLLRARGHRILPACPWARAFLAEHPDRHGDVDVHLVPLPV